jgi:hypothetical protein
MRNTTPSVDKFSFTPIFFNFLRQIGAKKQKKIHPETPI